MNVRKLAKIISYIRMNQKENFVYMAFYLYHNNKLIEHFICEGVYNQIPTEDKIEYNETNYHLPFFYGDGDFFIIEENTAIECAKKIIEELKWYFLEESCNNIKIKSLHTKGTRNRKQNFTLKINKKRGPK